MKNNRRVIEVVLIGIILVSLTMGIRRTIDYKKDKNVGIEVKKFESIMKRGNKKIGVDGYVFELVKYVYDAKLDRGHAIIYAKKTGKIISMKKKKGGVFDDRFELVINGKSDMEISEKFNGYYGYVSFNDTDNKKIIGINDLKSKKVYYFDLSPMKLSKKYKLDDGKVYVSPLGIALYKKEEIEKESSKYAIEPAKPKQELKAPDSNGDNKFKLIFNSKKEITGTLKLSREKKHKKTVTKVYQKNFNEIVKIKDLRQIKINGKPVM